jgi:hypothetical protein
MFPLRFSSCRMKTRTTSPVSFLRLLSTPKKTLDYIPNLAVHLPFNPSTPLLNMAITAKQAQYLAYFLPALAISITIVAVARPAFMQARQQTGNSEQTRQLRAIGQDIIAKRCYTLPTAPIKSQEISLPPASIHSSCIYGEGWYGFVAVLNGTAIVAEVYTQTQLDNILSTLKAGK